MNLEDKVAVPIWLLKSIVETEYSIAKSLEKFGGNFPTRVAADVLEILEEKGITFNNSTGRWI